MSDANATLDLIHRYYDAFNRGEILALATSKVLNEGINIPEASVAVVLSGSGSSREHIQRLGRILRKQPGKEAILYEVVTADTAEERMSDRRTNVNQFREARRRDAPSLPGEEDTDLRSGR